MTGFCSVVVSLSGLQNQDIEFDSQLMAFPIFPTFLQQSFSKYTFVKLLELHNVKGKAITVGTIIQFFKITENFHKY